MKATLIFLLVALAAAVVCAFDVSSYYATLSRRTSWADGDAYCSSKRMSLCNREQLCPAGGQPIGGARAKGVHWVPISGAGMNTWLGVGSDNSCEIKSHPVWDQHRSRSKGFVACCAHTGVIPAVLSKWEGFVVKGSDKSIFMVENGQRRKVPDPATFEAMGFAWSRVRSIPQPEFAAIPVGDAFPHLATGRNSRTYVHPVLKYAHEGGHPWDEYEGSLIKGTGPQIFMVELFEKRVIPDPNTFEAMGFEWDLIKTLPDTFVHSIPAAHPFPKLEGARNSAPYVHPIYKAAHFGRLPGPRIVSTREFARSVFRRLAERDPTDNELNSLDAALQKGAPVAAALRQIATSSEWLARFHFPAVVDAFFANYLERQVDAATRQLHVETLASVGSNADLREWSLKNLLLSKEYNDRFLAPNARNAVQYVFRHTVGRSPSPKELTASTKAVLSVGFEPLFEQLLSSAEYSSLYQAFGIPGSRDQHVYDGVIRRLYRKLLNREADEAGLVGWKQVMTRLGVASVVDGMLNSREFQELNGARAWYNEHDQPIEVSV